MSREFADAPIWDLQDALLDGAACRFDPELHDGPADPETAEQSAAREDVAKDVCRSCPVLAICETYTTRVRPVSGVWAGYTAAERAFHRSVLTGGLPGMGKSFPLLVVADECQEMFAHSAHGGEIGELTRAVLRLGRSVRVLPGDDADKAVA